MPGGFGGSASANTEYLRIHIRANSNSGEDQAVKYIVRDAVVEFLTPLVAEAETKEEAISLMNENLSGIERCADEVLRAHGFSYGAKARLTEEEFPTRVYGEYTLEAGVYQALILALGTGTGERFFSGHRFNALPSAERLNSIVFQLNVRLSSGR